jgi:hypothetical protein
MLPPSGIESAGVSRYAIELGLLERPGGGQPHEPAEIFYLRTDEIDADSSEGQLQRLADCVPASAGCVVLDGERSMGKAALRFANVCTKPVWLRRGAKGGGDVLYLPLARFDRLFPRAGTGVSQKATHGHKRSNHSFDRTMLRDIATGTLRPKAMGGYSPADSDLLCSLISPHVGMLYIHDRDCPAAFAQRLVDRTGKPAIVWHHYGRRLYVPRAAVARVLPLSGDALDRLCAVESGLGSPLYDKPDAGVGVDSVARIHQGRLTAAELGDYSDGMAVALSVLFPPDLKEIRLLDLDCPERFALLLADAAGLPVHLGAKVFEPGEHRAAGVPHAALQALPAGPRVAALSREEKARLLFMRQGRLLKEDLQAYDTRCVPRLVAGLDADLRRIEVLDPDCPPAFLHALADAADKPVLHERLVYVPSDPRPMPNQSEMDLPDNARRRRLDEELRRARVADGSIRSHSVQGMAPDALAELSAVVDPQARRPFVDADIDRETAQRLCNALGNSVSWGKERLQPDTAAHRWFDPSVLVPDDVGLIGWDDYRRHMENIAAHYAAQGVPVTLEYLAGEDGQPPALHLQVGTGQNHHLNTNNLHPNETHAWVADVHDAEWWCRNAYLLDEHDLSIHYYAFPPAVAKLNEPGLVGRPDPHAYAQYMVRSQVISGHPSHGYPFEIEDFSFSSYDQGVLAFCALVDGILALGQRILSAHSGHNAHMGAVPVVFLLLGQQIERLAALALRLEKMAADQGLKLLDIPAPEACQEPIPGALVSFQSARAAAQYAAGSPGGMTDIEYLEKRVLESGQPSFIGMLAEVSKWMASRVFDLTEGEVVRWKERMLGNLPALMSEAGEVLARCVAQEPALREDPVVQAALSVTGQAEEPIWGCNAPPPVASDPSTPVPPLEALCRIVVSPFYAATRAGQVVRALERCGRPAGLAEDLNARMHRVIDDVFRLGRVEDVPLEEGIRAFLKARSLLLQDALEQEQAAAAAA